MLVISNVFYKFWNSSKSISINFFGIKKLYKNTDKNFAFLFKYKNFRYKLYNYY